MWVVDGKDLTLRATVTDTGKYGTGLALDAAAKRLYVTNADGELVTIDTNPTRCCRARSWMSPKSTSS